jgi:ribosomal protein L29
MTKESKKDKLEKYSRKDIIHDIHNYKKKLFSLRFSRSRGELKDTSLFKKYKRQIAKLKTSLSQILIRG